MLDERKRKALELLERKVNLEFGVSTLTVDVSLIVSQLEYNEEQAKNFYPHAEYLKKLYAG